MPEPTRFYDAEGGGELLLQLQPVESDYLVLHRIGYRDPRYEQPFEVPVDTEHFKTDLASIPWFLSWLVPAAATTLPAFIVHDGLVMKPGEEKTYIGPDVDREEADRILRDALSNRGVPLVRRWLIWTAVIVATAFKTLRPRWYWRFTVVGTVLTVAVLGVLATLDLADAWDVLPWMGERSTLAEIGGGALFALLIPLALSVLWLRLWKAGAIVGISLAFLLHITAAVFTVYGVYWVIERALSAPEGSTPSVERNLEKAAQME